MNHLCECSCSETKLKVQSNNLESKEHKTTYKQPDQGRQQNKRDLDQPKSGRAEPRTSRRYKVRNREGVTLLGPSIEPQAGAGAEQPQSPTESVIIQESRSVA